MMKIKLMGDYRGVCTDELYYMAGIYTVPGEMSEGHAGALLAALPTRESRQALALPTKLVDSRDTVVVEVASAREGSLRAVCARAAQRAFVASLVGRRLRVGSERVRT